MKSVILFGTSAIIIATFGSPAFAQKSKREQIVASCIAQAQQQIPSSGDQNDPALNRRYNIYATCMKSKGARP